MIALIVSTSVLRWNGPLPVIIPLEHHAERKNIPPMIERPGAGLLG